MKRFAPAKINLSLEILGRRPDGFHDLRSLFLPISLVDELVIESAKIFSFSCSDYMVPSDSRNLVVQAAALFGRGSLPGVAIHLEKNIPHSAGLGGGSSDAATTLLTLNEMTGSKVSFSELVEMAAKLGSDVPFFLYRSSAWCEGRGERVTPIETPSGFAILLFKPPFGVPTPWAYHNLASSSPIPEISYHQQDTKYGMLVNDLERPVFEKFIYLAAVKKWMMQQPEVHGALMSGSGSTMFALIDNEEVGEILREKMQVEFGPANWIYIAHPWNDLTTN